MTTRHPIEGQKISPHPQFFPLRLWAVFLKDALTPDGPFVYRLGRQVFNLERGVRFPYGLPLQIFFLENQSVRTLFCPTVCNGGQKWDTFVLALCRAHLLRSGLGAHLLAGRFRVSSDLFGRLMPGDRHDFELRASKLRQARGGGLA